MNFELIEYLNTSIIPMEYNHRLTDRSKLQKSIQDKRQLSPFTMYSLAKLVDAEKVSL